MRKWFVSLFIVCFFLATISVTHAKSLIPYKVLENTDKHVVSIAVIFEMSNEEYMRRQEIKGRKESEKHVPQKWYKLCGIEDFIVDRTILRQLSDSIGISLLNEDESNTVKYVAYLGSGWFWKSNFVQTVNHLVSTEKQQNTTKMRVFVFLSDASAVLPAEIYCRTEEKEFWDDYAVLFIPGEKLGLPGLKLAKHELRKGDVAYWIGSPGGLAFFGRIGFITKQRFYVSRHPITGQLTLQAYEGFYYTTTYPGGPGDSGGVIVNAEGEVTGQNYCGVQLYGENYIFSNPLSMLWRFVKEFRLEKIVR